jgi:hypothetical protein
MNYAQNIANKKYPDHDQRLRDHFAFRLGKAFHLISLWIGIKGAEDLCWALSNAPMDKRVQWLEWYVDALRMAGWRERYD